MLDSVRTRLTLWYAGVLALSLLAFAFVTYYAAASIFYERQDASLHSTAQTVASAYVEELEEQHSQAKAGQVLLSELVFPERYVQVIDTNGRLIASSRNMSRAILVPASSLAQVSVDRPVFLTIDGLRVAVISLASDHELGYAVVAEPVSIVALGLRRLQRAFLAGVPLVLLLASVGGYFLARKSLHRIAVMNSQTERISAKSLSSRLDVTNPRDELGQLALTINDLLARLENSFNEQQRFIADASHELRTPLAVLRGETEIALEQTRTIDDYQRSLSLIQDEAERLSRIVEDLFILARAPIDVAREVTKQQLSLNKAVVDCVRAANVLAKQKGVNLKTDENSEPIWLVGDEELLKRMILNLLDNAVKYTPEGGQISIAQSHKKGKAQLIVSDSGIGIPEAVQARVFDRFYRIDKARSRALGGAGLGLSIARSIVEIHGGRIDVVSTPGRGSTFTVELPCSPD